jgi:very-short-patch-repair endonuclease
VLEDEGWLVLVFTADDVLRRRADTVRRVRSALAQRRAV